MKKTLTIGMMTIMMVLGTTTGFGKTTNHGRPVNNPKAEVVVINNGHGHMHNKMMDKCCHREHRHILDRYHHNCRICRIPLDRFGRPLPPPPAPVHGHNHIHR